MGRLFTALLYLIQAGDGGDVIEHPANLTDIVMFSFKKKSDKQKVRKYATIFCII